LLADTESASVPSQNSPSTQVQTPETDDDNAEASQNRPKRGRSPESEGSEYAPNKRPRLRRDASTRVLRYVRPTPQHFQEPVFLPLTSTQTSSPASVDTVVPENARTRLRRRGTEDSIGTQTSSLASVDTVVPENARTRLRRRGTEDSIGTNSMNTVASRSEDQSGHVPGNEPVDLPPDFDETAPRSRKTSRASLVNTIHSKFTAMVCSFNQSFSRSPTVKQNKDVPVAFTFFNPTTDLPITSSGDGARPFSDVLHESSITRIGQPLAHQRDKGVGANLRRDRLYTSSRIDRATTGRRDSSHRSLHSSARDPFPFTPAAGTTPSSLRVGNHLGGDIRQPQDAHTTLGAPSTGGSLTVDHPRQQGSSSKPSVRHLSRRSSRPIGEGYGPSTGMF
jgi:hypothetical protein